MPFVEYQINTHITLKLESDGAVIYIDGEVFIACKELLLNTVASRLEELNYISSIDELEQKLGGVDPLFSKQNIKLPPETEFWAHCSNIQSWAEHDYDTRLLHSNLAFPLLKQLVEVGDIIALKVFKEEIVKRIESGFPSVVYFLINEGYTNYISREDFLFALLNFSEAEALFNLEEILGRELAPSYDSYDVVNSFFIKDKQVEGLNIYNLNLQNLDLILTFTSLTFLSLVNVGIKFISDSIRTLKEIKYLDLNGNELSSLSNSIGFMTEVEELYLDDNSFNSLPEPIKNLQNLKVLSVSGNKIENIPDYIWNLRKLEVLNLAGNRIRIIPDSIQKLENLEELYLIGNFIKKLPEAVKDLEYLHRVDIEFKDS